MSLKETNNNDNRDRCDIHILDSISINLDEEDTFDDPSDTNDNECDNIDLDIDLPNMLMAQHLLLKKETCGWSCPTFCNIILMTILSLGRL